MCLRGNGWVVCIVFLTAFLESRVAECAGFAIRSVCCFYSCSAMSSAIDLIVLALSFSLSLSLAGRLIGLRSTTTVTVTSHFLIAARPTRGAYVLCVCAVCVPCTYMFFLHPLRGLLLLCRPVVVILFGRFFSHRRRCLVRFCIVFARFGTTESFCLLCSHTEGARLPGKCRSAELVQPRHPATGDTRSAGMGCLVAELCHHGQAARRDV